MAEEEEKIEKPEKTEGTSGNKGSLIGYIITFVVALVCAGGGYGLSGVFAKAAPKPDLEIEEKKAEEEKYESENPDAGPWLLELQPITANLNVVGVSRMIQLTIVLEMSAKMDEVKGRAFLEKKTIHLRDWLGTYLAGLNLDHVKGSANQSRMKVEIKESFNEILFPDTTRHIQKAMLKDVIIQ